jgi:hypothetical protein
LGAIEFLVPQWPFARTCQWRPCSAIKLPCQQCCLERIACAANLDGLLLRPHSGAFAVSGHVIRQDHDDNDDNDDNDNNDNNDNNDDDSRGSH